MCGRYQITRDGVAYWRFFKGGRGEVGRWVEEPIIPHTGPSYDPILDPEPLHSWQWPTQSEVKPTELIPIIRLEEGRPEARMASWWLLPPWAGNRVIWTRAKKDGHKYFRWKPGRAPGTHFNSKQSTLTEPKTYWWTLLAEKRCAFPADGFVEWPDKEDAKARGITPGPGRLFRLQDGEPFFIAGVWEEGKDDEGQPFLSANLITTHPNQLLLDLPHHRMPAILRTPGDVWAWLNAPNPEAAATLLQTIPSEVMEEGPWPPQ